MLPEGGFLYRPDLLSLDLLEILETIHDHSEFRQRIVR